MLGPMRARAACLLMTLLLPRVAFADQTPAQQEADRLFQEGKALMDQGAHREACEKLAESLALLRRGGTLLNLAVCRNKEGRYATALRVYQEALDAAVADKRTDREEIARRDIEEVRAKLSWLTVRAPDAAKTPGLAITLDGSPVDPPQWGKLLPIDPGDHVVIAAAPDHRPFRAAFAIGKERDRKEVLVPALTPAPKPSSPPMELPPPRAPSTTRLRTFGIPTLIAGSLIAAVGGGLGVKAIVDSRRSKELCPNRRCTTEEGLAANESARTAATLANVVIPVGLLIAASGLFLTLYTPQPSSPRRASNLFIAPSFGASGAALTVGGLF